MTATPEPTYYEPIMSWPDGLLGFPVALSDAEFATAMSNEKVQALLARMEPITEFKRDVEWGIRYRGDTRSLSWKLHRVMFYGIACLFRRAIAGGKESE